MICIASIMDQAECLFVGKESYLEDGTVGCVWAYVVLVDWAATCELCVTEQVLLCSQGGYMTQLLWSDQELWFKRSWSAVTPILSEFTLRDTKICFVLSVTSESRTI